MSSRTSSMWRLGALAAVFGALVTANAPALAQTTTMFQEGVGGYTGFLDIFISQNAGSIPNGGPDGNVLGVDVRQKFVDGIHAERPSQDQALIEVQYLMKWDNILGAGPGQIPLGATITNASLTLTSGDGSNAQTNGDWGVGQMLMPFDATSTWNTLSGTGGAGAAFIGGASDRPLDHAFMGPIAASGATPVQASADITRIVQNWSSGAANHGMLLRAGTTDGWQIMTSGALLPELRPKLSVTYTMVPPPAGTTVTLKQGAGGYMGTSMAFLQSGLPDMSGMFPNQMTTDASTLEYGFIDGPNLSGTSADDQALIKFNNIFTSQGGPVPDTATILEAQLVVDTASPVQSNAIQSSGEMGVHRMLVDWNMTSLYTDFGGNGPTEAQNEIGPVLDTTGAVIADARAYLDVTAAVNAWKSGASNFGLNIRSENTADGWGIEMLGSPDSPPHLVIKYTTDVVPTEDADFDGDNDVDGADFLTWQRGLGTASGATLAQGDANGDGAITGADLTIWRAQFGPAAAAGAASAVPEPASAVMVVMALLAAGGALRRRA